MPTRRRPKGPGGGQFELRAARSPLRLGEAYEIQQVLPSGYPTEFDELLTSSRSVGMRMLAFLDGCGADVVERIQERLNGEVSPDYERRVLRERQGQKSAVTVEMILLAVLVCAQIHKSFRRTDILRTLIGLHEDVARRVGLIDGDGSLFVPTYKAFVWQMRRVESVLAEGWTAQTGWLTPVRCDLHWLVQALLKASVPRKARRQIRHVGVDATSVRSWGTWLPKVTKTDIQTEPVAVAQRMAVEEDHDDIPEPDLEGLWEAVTKSDRLVRFGADGRPRYSHDRDATIGYNSPRERAGSLRRPRLRHQREVTASRTPVRSLRNRRRSPPAWGSLTGGSRTRGAPELGLRCTTRPATPWSGSTAC